MSDRAVFEAMMMIARRLGILGERQSLRVVEAGTGWAYQCLAPAPEASGRLSLLCIHDAGHAGPHSWETANVGIMAPLRLAPRCRWYSPLRDGGQLSMLSDQCDAARGHDGLHRAVIDGAVVTWTDEESVTWTGATAVPFAAASLMWAGLPADMVIVDDPIQGTVTLEYCGARSPHNERCSISRGHDGEHHAFTGTRWEGDWCEFCEARTDGHSTNCPGRTRPRGKIIDPPKDSSVFRDPGAAPGYVDLGITDCVLIVEDDPIRLGGPIHVVRCSAASGEGWRCIFPELHGGAHEWSDVDNVKDLPGSAYRCPHGRLLGAWYPLRRCEQCNPSTSPS